MLDASLPLTVGEYESGESANSANYFYVKSYCPYPISPQTLSRIWSDGLHDSQVMYWGPAKYGKTPHQTDHNPCSSKSIWVQATAGLGRYDYLREVGLDFAFLLQQLGIHS
jgi:protease II